MAAAVALSNYQLGDILGRGASGSVYRALNFLTGETVAIKSISLLSLPPSSLPDIMSEIDLLKNLNHSNIVKYKGFARDKENLFIVLEYCENGSLQTILKKFGKFPESLVAVYISQVLEGLIYLHEQGVIHRDIKGANILTNKDGSVKLADFGVSSRSTQPALGAEANDNEVVGSPYWMAPEVIEQSGASTASDIWSVGCVVVELLEGKPPFGDLAPMQALWRIVQDESMRIPEGASPIVRDFLYHCFQKDPNLRITAKKLLRHPWMLSVRRATEPPSIPAQPKSTTDGTSQSRNGGARINSGGKEEQSSAQPSGIGTVGGKKFMTVYDEAVHRVQQWNEALNAPKSLATMRRLPVPRTRNTNEAHKRQRAESGRPLNLFALPSRSSTDSIVAQMPSAVGVGITSNGAPGLLQKNFHLSDVLSRSKENETAGESWDDDFAADITLSRLGHRQEDSTASEDLNEKTLRPIKSPPLGTKAPSQLSADLSMRSISASGVDDYSDMAFGESETGLEAKLANLKLKSKGRRGLMHPDDIRKVPLSFQPWAPSKPLRSLSTLTKPASPVNTIHHSASSALPLPPSPYTETRSPPALRSSSLRGKASTAKESQVALHKYTETEDEDYEDIFEGHQAQINDINAGSTPSLQLTRRANTSWQGSDGDDDAADPFAEIDDDFDTEDLEANLLRDKRATLFASVNKLIDGLGVSMPAATLRANCDELLVLLDNTPEMGLEAHFVAQHGMLAVLEILESRISRDVGVRLLKLVNLIVMSDVELLESFCLIGGIPVIIPYTSKKHSLQTRLEASAFIHQLTRSALTLQMFISCRGLRILVELLDEDYTVNKNLILSSLEGIKMFVREGILDPLSTALLAILQDDEIKGDDEAARAIGVLLLFCQVAQADGRVKEAFASRPIMVRLLKACEVLPRKLLVTAIKAIKHLSTSPQLIEVLQNSNAMEILVDLLGRSIKGSHSNEICSHIFQTIYSMTRLSKSRQEEAASSGIIPLLKTVIQNKSPLKQFALPILCDLANAGKGSRRLLWQNDGMKLYLDLLEDPYWRVSALDAILAWMQDETARVEDVLLEKSSSDNLVRCFVQASGVSFEGILDPFLKILRLSTSLTSCLSHPPFFHRLADTLDRSTKAVVKLNLLRLTKVVCETHPDRESLVARFGLVEIVERLSRQDGAILVRELAKEVLPGLLFGAGSEDPLATAEKMNKGGESVGDEDRDGEESVMKGGGLRRAMSENVVLGHRDDLRPSAPTSNTGLEAYFRGGISSYPATDNDSNVTRTVNKIPQSHPQAQRSVTVSRSGLESKRVPVSVAVPITPLRGGEVKERPKHKDRYHEVN